MRRPVSVPGWLLLSLALVVGANFVAGLATTVTIELMRGVSEFADRVRANDLAWLPLWLTILYPVSIAAGLAYVWPLVAFFRCGGAEGPSPRVRRRAVSAPLVVAGIGFATWLSGIVVFPLLTVATYGRWSTDLMSQHVLSPLVNGFLAATTSYLVLDWVFRTRVIPNVFPDGRLAEVSDALTLRVRGRLVVFLIAVAFLPLFTMLGLVQAAAARLRAGMPIDAVVPALIEASQGTFALYVVLGLVLTVLLARTFTRPLGDVADALRRVRSGGLGEPVQVTATDEIGVLEEGVNAMAATLRERERIMQTFGRVVEPVVRDRLLAGDLRAEGEERTASVLFCDLRGFTSLAERTPPRELVRMLNQFFTAMTAWARECGGFVDKFIGDGVLVVFGLFEDDGARGPADGAAAAVRCALGMRERLVRLNEERGAAGQPPLAMKIGVHTGPVIAGTLGAADRHEYTVVGDTVNVASRLEELCGDWSCEVVVSETTWRLAAAGGMALPSAERTETTARGRGGALEVWRVA